MKPTRRLIYLEIEKRGTCSVADLEPVLNIRATSIRRELNRMHDDKLAYIKEYVKPVRGNNRPMWALGNKAHRPAPKPLAPGIANASNRASKYANRAKEMQDKALLLRRQADELERRAKEYIEENKRIKVITRVHIEKPKAQPVLTGKASPWAQLIR